MSIQDDIGAIDITKPTVSVDNNKTIINGFGTLRTTLSKIKSAIQGLLDAVNAINSSLASTIDANSLLGNNTINPDKAISLSITQVKTLLGFNNVDNTRDTNKPISSATQTALNDKQTALVSGTTIKTVNGNSLLGSGDLTISGGGNSFISGYVAFLSYSSGFSSGTFGSFYFNGSTQYINNFSELTTLSGQNFGITSTGYKLYKIVLTASFAGAGTAPKLNLENTSVASFALSFSDISVGSTTVTLKSTYLARINGSYSTRVMVYGTGFSTNGATSAELLVEIYKYG